MIDPLKDYTHEPAPMGIADFGVTGTGSGDHAYSYASHIFQGSAAVNSMSVTISGTSSKVTAFELNAVLVLQLGGSNYSYWIQNGLHVDASSREYTIGGAYVWNFSSPTAHLSASEVRGNASSMLASDTYYFIPGCGVFPGQCSALSWPSTLTGRVVTGTGSGIPYVDYQYDLGAGWVTYDNVSFPHMANATDVGFVVDGYQPTPISAGEFYDAEWVWVAAGGGGSSTVKASDLTMSLDYWNGETFQAVPNAWDFGSNTGETASNATETATVGNPDGAPAAHLANGAGTLGVLYNQSRVGTLQVAVPVRTGSTLDLNGTAVPIPSGTLNLTLAAGTYSASLENYSNASQRFTISPGATTVVNFSGAGRVAFTESGLPVGTSWEVSLGGAIRSSTASSVAFNVPNGTYSVRYPGVPGYYRNSTDPSTITVPNLLHVAISWSPFTFQVPFTEEGLPAATLWWINVSGSLVSGSGTTISVPAPNGSTPYLVGSTYEFVASPASGEINVTGGAFAPYDVLFQYRPTFISGTIDPSNGSVSIDGVAVTVIQGSFNDSVTPGSYTLVASASGYVPKTLIVNTTAGNVSSVRIVLAGVIVNPIAHSDNSTTSGGLPPIELLAGVGVGGLALIGVLLLLYRRRIGPR